MNVRPPRSIVEQNEIEAGLGETLRTVAAGMQARHRVSLDSPNAAYRLGAIRCGTISDEITARLDAGEPAMSVGRFFVSQWAQLDGLIPEREEDR
jgi:hypothetical protein